MFDALQEAIRTREVERRYLGLVKGRPRSRTGRIDAPIGRDRRDPTKRSLDTEEPRDAVTWFEVVETLPEHALLDVKLETGRTHQIRVHLAAIDLPCPVTRRYGVKGDLGLERQFLHAHRLRFVHPVTGARSTSSRRSRTISSPRSSGRERTCRQRCVTRKSRPDR